MLDISKPLTSAKVQSYYRSEYSSASNSYFSQVEHCAANGTANSRPSWDSPGSSGEAFDRLAEGQHPQTGEQLIQHRDTIKTQSGEEVGHRAGWDLTFNAPKTVSLTALVGEDERVREAHRNAVRVHSQKQRNMFKLGWAGMRRRRTRGSGSRPPSSTIQRVLWTAIPHHICIPTWSCSI